ncbi:hypothetical protein HB662_01500 [Roseomonas frigidaquae]|uniref:Uncharacterized protein n=1 Tax=Falsiroseomonas frigidaquae TaxID=487318 RepID=A0ABX1EU45_9PROT|nr:hypothetical protein [Falsiroseomonas frigidaquae]NKE43434.1 hypothetical protein [Falsiroseomonas frigidaquae]
MSEKLGSGSTDPADVDWDGDYSPLLIWQEIDGKIRHWMMMAASDEEDARARRPPPQLSRRALTYLAAVAAGFHAMTVHRLDPRDYFKNVPGSANPEPRPFSREVQAFLDSAVPGLQGVPLALWDPRELRKQALAALNAKPPEISASDAAKLAPMVLGLTREDGHNAFDKYWSVSRKARVAQVLEWARDQRLSQRQQEEMLTLVFGISDLRTARRYLAEVKVLFPPLTQEEADADAEAEALLASRLSSEKDSPGEGQG